jgi:uncharacterized protein YabE (DUF348 family)
MTRLYKGYRWTVFLAILLFMSIISIAIYDRIEKEIIISVDGQVKEIKTYSQTVEELLVEEGIEVNNKDYINVSLNAELKDNLRISIKRAVPVTINIGNKKIQGETTKDTVKELLKDLRINVDNDDEVIPGLNEKITANMEINVTKIEEIIRMEKEDIPYSTKIKYNNNLLKGEVREIQQGKEGLKEIKVREIYKNGELEEKQILEETVKLNPIHKIIEKGTKEYLVTSRGNVTYRRSLIMTSTAYDLSYQSTGKRPGDPGYGITAMGTKARPGVVAVDPRVIPLGTKLYIKSLDGTPDYGFAVAEDTGGAVKGNRIDLFFENHSEALKYGIKKVKVYIIE